MKKAEQTLITFRKAGEQEEIQTEGYPRRDRKKVEQTTEIWSS